MARVLENVAKEILKANGIATPAFAVAKTPQEAQEAANRIGYPVVVKALVTVGKRGKTGAVKFADDAREVQAHAQTILGMTVRNFPVEALLIESKLAITRELYFSVTYDATRRMPVIIVSAEGGVDIEEIAESAPEKIVRHHVDLTLGFHPYQAKELCSAMGLEGKTLQRATQTVYRLYKNFEKVDATVLEVNPLVLTEDGGITAAAVLMGVDDDAFYRQPALADKVEVGTDRSWRPLTELEKEMVAVDAAESYRGTARYTEMEGGDIGFLCGGGGGSLLAYDSLLQCGGQPANYTEFGGNPTETKVAGLVKGVLSKPGVKSFFMDANITNNTQTDIVAKGIVKAFQEMKIDPTKFPAVVRLAGVNDTEAKKIFTDFHIEYYGDDISMEDAARVIVDRMKAVKRE
ncbi:MAG: acetate--CoA ligase family protein [Desulfobacterales bacterium]|nr:acetate--CoA ligase family protein [Desulfobacterales bacterium]